MSEFCFLLFSFLFFFCLGPFFLEGSMADVDDGIGVLRS
jgi:hypothetical protein